VTVRTTALEMSLRLGQLMKKHDITLTPITITLAAPTDYPMILEGYAATTDIDHQRMKLRAYAFGFPLRKQFRNVPLLYRHDPTQVAGRIDEIDYDERGNLRVRATVTHALAKRCGAFSIGARILDYEMRDELGPDFHALVTSAELTEVSVTPSPANPFALVQRRSRASARAEFYNDAIKLVSCMQEFVGLLQQEIKNAHV
jgi:HK97 family phage prohead protease